MAWTHFLLLKCFYFKISAFQHSLPIISPQSPTLDWELATLGDIEWLFLRGWHKANPIERLPQSEPNWAAQVKMASDNARRRYLGPRSSWYLGLQECSALFVQPTLISTNTVWKICFPHSFSEMIRTSQWYCSDLAILKNQSNKQGMKAHHCAL